MVGGTYRVTYLGDKGTNRQFIGQFHGLEADPIVTDTEHIAFHFTMTTPRIEDLATGKTMVVESPDPSQPIHFHLWQEDLVDIKPLVKGAN